MPGFGSGEGGSLSGEGAPPQSLMQGVLGAQALMQAINANMDLYDFNVSLTANVAKVVFPADARRWGILISSCTTNIVQVGWSLANMAVGKGLCIPTSGGFFWMNFDFHGILVTRPIYAICASAQTLYCVNIDLVH